MIKLADIKNKVEKISKKIEVPEILIPTFGDTEDFARPHIEINEKGLHWVVVERGEEIERRTTQSEDQLLYWIFETVTSSMASKYAAKNPVVNESFRRTMFSHQLKLLEQLNPQWKKERKQEISIIYKNG